ncbi:hypothetical protein [Ramlibacter pallidus]|uniref:Uncharacterized protein n=1 Tax=Ramlibacter pallidus TaxID=2780087 RepID=A0ABR9RZM4_9BURK|nr:hypothetical protein [Ramlibacter pallidus]MBE7366711.1 hypothetical protein [Ramlibacter pallidus]
MRLDYLLFDSSDEDSGHCSFDALASVLPERLPALVAEVEAVLRWAHRAFGLPDADGGEWDYALQLTGADGEPLVIAYDAALGGVRLPGPVTARVALALTLGGSPAFASAFLDAFPDA